MAYMYDNGTEENIKEFLNIIQGHYYQEVSNKPCWLISLGNM